jgi:hypothetical protein
MDSEDAEVQAAIDGRFAPPDRDALTATVGLLAIAKEIAGALTPNDTIDGLLLKVTTSFHDFAGPIVRNPWGRDAISDMPGSGVTGAVWAGIHVVAVANLLNFITGQRQSSSPGIAENSDGHPDAHDDRWLYAIVDICELTQEPPWYVTTSDYMCFTASVLSTAVKTFQNIPRISLDPDDPSVTHKPYPHMRKETPEETAVRLAWCAASALCINAAVHPDFRFGSELPVQRD